VGISPVFPSPGSPRLGDIGQVSTAFSRVDDGTVIEVRVRMKKNEFRERNSTELLLEALGKPAQ
jgi:hypothetical protein